MNSVHMPRQRRKRNRELKFSFVLDNACDERTKPLVSGGYPAQKYWKGKY